MEKEKETRRYYSRQFLSDFISLYRSFPCLWQAKCEDYTDRCKKNAAYQKLVEKYREIDPKATKLMVKNKINSLRTCYRKEKRKVLFSKFYSNEYDGVYVPNLWYYKLLTFVDDENPRQVINRRPDVPKGDPSPEVSSHLEANKLSKSKPLKRKNSSDRDPDYRPTSKRLLMLGQEENKIDNETSRQSSFRKQSIDIDSSVKGSPLRISLDSIEQISDDDEFCTSPARSPPHDNPESNGNDDEVDNVVSSDPEPSSHPLEYSTADTINDSAIFSCIPGRLQQTSNRINGLVDGTEQNRKSPWKHTYEVRQEDCHDIFARNVACKLRSVPNEQRIYLEKIINDAIFEAEMKNLNGQCYLHVPNRSTQDSSSRNCQVKNEGQ